MLVAGHSHLSRAVAVHLHQLLLELQDAVVEIGNRVGMSVALRHQVLVLPAQLSIGNLQSFCLLLGSY